MVSCHLAMANPMATAAIMIMVRWSTCGSSDQLISFDPQTGLLVAEAGLMLSEIIAIAAPHGYFLPVTPGTRFVTFGGAIANDVHGKNHHRRGTFGYHVERFDLLKSDGTVVPCSASMNSKLFAATIGGLGLTGIILSASIRLMKVKSLDVVEAIKPLHALTNISKSRPRPTMIMNMPLPG